MGGRKALPEQTVRAPAATYLRSYLGPTTRSRGGVPPAGR